MNCTTDTVVQFGIQFGQGVRWMGIFIVNCDSVKREQLKL